MKLLWTVHLVQYIYRSIHPEPSINSEQWRSSCRETFIVLCCSLGLCPEREREQTYCIFLTMSIICEHKAIFNRLASSVLFSSGKICCALSNLFKPFYYLFVCYKEKRENNHFVFASLHMGISSSSWSKRQCSRKAGVFQKTEVKSQGQEGGRRYEGVPVPAQHSVRSACLYAMCMRARAHVFEWGIKGPVCRAARSW